MDSVIVQLPDVETGAGGEVSGRPAVLRLGPGEGADFGRGAPDAPVSIVLPDPGVSRRAGELVAARGLSAVVRLQSHRDPCLENLPVPGTGTVRHGDQGCRSQAQRKLYGDPPTGYRARKVTDALPDLVRAAVFRDARHASVVPDRAACMRDRGPTYEHPPRACERFLRADLPDEVATARAGAECALSTGLAGTARDIDRAYRADIDSR